MKKINKNQIRKMDTFLRGLALLSAFSFLSNQINDNASHDFINFYINFSYPRYPISIYTWTDLDNIKIQKICFEYCRQIIKFSLYEEFYVHLLIDSIRCSTYNFSYGKLSIMINKTLETILEIDEKLISYTGYILINSSRLLAKLESAVHPLNANFITTENQSPTLSNLSTNQAGFLQEKKYSDEKNFSFKSNKHCSRCIIL